MTSTKDELIKKLEDKTATIGIVGLGYVGLPLVLRYSEIGYTVLGIDIDTAKVEKLNAGNSYIQHISDDSIQKAINSGFKATTDFTETSNTDALILCVPTPLSKYREPDLSFVLGTTDSLIPYLRKGQVVSLESTTYPGTTDEQLLPRLEKSKLTIGEELFLVYSPEREDPGNPKYSASTIPKICSGLTSNCLEVGIALYKNAVVDVVPVSSTKTAEMIKLLENIHRAVNIGLVNELKIVADKMGIDIHEVVNAAGTKPFGFTPYYPGPGLGGHCIPIDPFYLTWKAREYGLNTRFIELAGEVNAKMPDWVVDKVSDGLNANGKPLNGSKVLVLGVAYKKNVDDIRESPAAVIMDKLRDKGAHVEYSDPHIPVFPKMRSHSFDLKSVDLTAQNINEFDCLVLTTDHDNFDYEFIKQQATLLIDTRGRYLELADNIVKA
ncbi:MAG: nucleotide sugar dehydrogenase [Proteobacteria bacterium]|nr:nucleotide sugar dehydrogenase [Pseudomonadota bacterium]